MRIVEGSRTLDLEEFLSRPLFAHLATSSPLGPRESPVWFLWKDQAFWIIGDKQTDTFPKRIDDDPRVALGIVDFDVATGLVHHVGIRGRAEIAEFDISHAKSIFRKYLGPDEKKWDTRFTKVEGDNHLFVKIIPETVVVRDQSYTL